MAMINKITSEKAHGLSSLASVDDRELLYLLVMADVLTKMHEVVMDSWDTFGKSVAHEMRVNRKSRIIKQKLQAEENSRAHKVFQEKKLLRTS